MLLRVVLGLCVLSCRREVVSSVEADDAIAEERLRPGLGLFRETPRATSSAS